MNGTAAWPYAPGVVVHPAPLYEVIALGGIFVLLLHLRSRVAPAGALFAIYLLCSGLTRLLVELIRTNPRRAQENLGRWCALLPERATTAFEEQR